MVFPGEFQNPKQNMCENSDWHIVSFSGFHPDSSSTLINGKLIEGCTTRFLEYHCILISTV